MNTTKLKLIDIKVSTTLGVYDHEKILRDFFVSLEVQLSPTCDFSSDNLVDTVDSGYLEEIVRSSCQGKNFDLLEAMAHYICDDILKLEKIDTCLVSIGKPGCLQYTKSVEVEVHKSK